MKSNQIYVVAAAAFGDSHRSPALEPMLHLILPRRIPSRRRLVNNIGERTQGILAHGCPESVVVRSCQARPLEKPVRVRWFDVN